MNAKPRGMRCDLPPYGINKLLLFLSQLPGCFYMPWCDKIEKSTQLLPRSLADVYVTAQELRGMEYQAIWELVLHIYPVGAEKACIKTYRDFMDSNCRCCLIYYDCGNLDIYIKEADLFQQIQARLLSLRAEALEFLTDTNDDREALHL